MSDWNLLSGDAVRQVRQLVAEQLANGRPAPERMHLRRRPTFEASQDTSVTYKITKGVEVYGGTSSNPKVDYSNPTCWIGATRRYGEQTYVEYDNAEAAPSTNGNFLVKATGRYRFTFGGTIYVDRNSTTLDAVSVYTDYQLSSPNNHRHSVDIPGDVAEAGVSWAPLRVQLHRKPDGGAMAVYQDDIADLRYLYWHPTVATSGPDSARVYIATSGEWEVDLEEDDRFALKYSISYSSYDDKWEYSLHDGLGSRLRIEYIGESLAWEAV